MWTAPRGKYDQRRPDAIGPDSAVLLDCYLPLAKRIGSAPGCEERQSASCGAGPTTDLASGDGLPVGVVRNGHSAITALTGNCGHVQNGLCYPTALPVKSATRCSVAR